MKQGIILILLFSILPLFGAISCEQRHVRIEKNTYYVSPSGSDRDTGSKSSPFRTIGKAVSVAKAGDTVLVGTGTYNEQISFPRDGTFSARIVVKAEVNAKPPILDSNNSRLSAFVLNGRNYITIQGFEITRYTASPIDVTSASNGGTVGLEVRNNYIHNAGTWEANNRSAGVRLLGTKDVKILDNTITKISGYAIFAAHHSAGIRGADDLVVRGNDLSYSGIDIIYGSGYNWIIEGNYLHHTTEPVKESEHADHIQYCTADAHRIENANYIIRNNIFAYGYQRANSSNYIIVGGHGRGLIYNNLMYGGAYNGILIQGSPNVKIFNNTVLESKNQGIYAYKSGNYSVPSTNIKVFNNIVLPTSGGAIGTSSNSSSGYEASNNITSGDPKFVDKANRDYRLKAGSLAIDKGYVNTSKKLPYPATDLDGRTRVVNGVIDIGVFEY